MTPPRHPFFRSFVFWLGVAWRTLFAPSFGAVLRHRVRDRAISVNGLDHVPTDGAVVFAANHYWAGSTLDVIAATLTTAARVRPGIDDACAVVIGQRVRTTARRWPARIMVWLVRRFFDRWRKNLLRIHTASPTPTGLAELREWRRRTRTGPTFVFPEGAANKVLGDLRPGAGNWLAGSGVTVIPVGVWWENERWNVVFGAPIAWARNPELCDLQLGLAMAALLPEALCPAWQADLAQWRRAHEAVSYAPTA